ncbi:hypothetical protein FisN_30Hh066 [Fistulifera solaris]|uniref:Uncharacterized protein n=1 Tax=Fistulifera solaris TaxID=1519565 RepID=A0A1Z5K6P7_FISSO|nr:hypothetical protein FisN_30Hh066 [Fistulifera solaris]|eukprot:GAX21865.1 hypothetical protein FisN_30Hh066 [Fistulifera solaris]
METTTTSDPRLMSIPAPLRLALIRILQTRCIADALPSVFHLFVHNGKITSLVFVALYLLFVSIWFPFYLLALAVSEWGVYTILMSAIIFGGRAFIRMIAFPGSNSGVVKEIENEFSKYSVRMLLAASNAIIEVLSVIVPGSSEGSSISRGDVASQWNHALSYKDRVLGVYLESLLYLFRQPPSATHPKVADLTRFGNNKLTGDLGDLSGLTLQARADGRTLLEQLSTIIHLMDEFEASAKSILEPGARKPTSQMSDESRKIAKQLLSVMMEFRDFVTSLKPVATTTESSDDRGEEDPADAIRRRIEEQNGSLVDFVKSGLSSLIPMIDPPPHNSIFCFDLQRGCMMSRYRGATQFWVRRPSGGMLDVLLFPARGQTSQGTRNSKAVLYCNPNAGLIEVATGMSLVGGNVPTADPDNNTHDHSWADFYTAQGYDFYTFNYAGYGRSFGSTFCLSGQRADEHYYPGFWSRLKRVFKSSFLSFRPTTDTLREDGTTVALHLLNDLGIQKLVVHGESIGGVAASGVGHRLSQMPGTQSKISLLICDRTFCNLESVAQRLVGGWSGYAIRALAPFWNSDVMGPFLAASCPKVVANDAADVIISDSASLRSGIALWKELYRGSKASASATRGIGWFTEEPLHYRMANWEDVCVNDSRYVSSSFHPRAPSWPSDRFITMEEAFHFAACCKRIGKVARRALSNGLDIDGEGLPGSHPVVVQAWTVLSCCSGLTGSTLGASVKRGHDTTVTWLCSLLVFGGQTVVGHAERRLSSDPTRPLTIVPADFDERPAGYQQQESPPTKVFPKPIPEVLERLSLLLEHNTDDSLSSVSHEMGYIIGMLQYAQERITASVALYQSSRNLQDSSPYSTGCFLNLHCGHNNGFSKSEKQRLSALLRMVDASIPVV